MPTLRLYDPNPAHPNASHRVTAPGGYERWYFDADDGAQDVQVVATFALGGDSNADYLRSYDRYRRRPTRFPPPVPSEYPSVSLDVYERGRPVAKFAERVPPTQFSASAERLDVKAAEHCAAEQSDESIRVLAGGAELSFRPLLPLPPQECLLLKRRDPTAVHKWIIAAPLCAVEGTVRLDGGRAIRLAGRGYHDHQYGTAPLADAMRWFIRGRKLSSDRATISFLEFPTDKPRPGFVRVVEAGREGVTVKGGGLFAGDPYGPRARFLDSSRWTKNAEGEDGRALYERIVPKRARWPFIGRPRGR